MALTKLYASLFLGIDVEALAPAAVVTSLQTPLLLIHRTHDRQFPLEQARAIYANANPTTTQFWIVEGADHALAHTLTGPECERKVLRFFEQHLLSTTPP